MSFLNRSIKILGGRKISRRQLIQGSSALGALALTSQVWRTGTANAQGNEVIVGFIYVGPRDDFGYNQSHFEGKEGIKDLVKTVDEENVPETTAVQESMRAMIDLDGVNVLFPTSFGHFDPHILEVAREYPDVQFFHCGGLYQEGVHPENVGSYFGYIDEAQYVAGVVAALTSGNGQLGFIAAKPIPQVLRNINSFTLGARSVRPEATTQVIFTGDWALPVREAEAANSMADQGIDVITCHVDSPKIVMETAERRGIYCSGYHANQLSLAPAGYLTGAEWDWTNVYTRYVNDIKEGKTLMNGGIPHLVRGGLADGFCKLSDYGPAVSAEARAAAETAQSQLLARELVIYKGELMDNSGTVILPEGEEYPQTALELEEMGWLVEGVLGSV